eukprot:gene15869-18857_t
MNCLCSNKIDQTFEDGTLACAWTGAGCICAQSQEVPMMVQKNEQFKQHRSSGAVDIQDANFYCDILATNGQGTYIFQGMIGYGQIVTCPKTAPGLIGDSHWVAHEGCKSGGSLQINANLINFSCECTKFNGCIVKNIIAFTYTK